MSSTSLDLYPKYFGIGHRKCAVAKVTLIPGAGSIIINQLPGEVYLQFNPQYINALKAPLLKVGLATVYDIHVNTHGGGLSGQVDAMKLGIARSLCYVSFRYKNLLKMDGYLIRDSRCKERKKYGLRKARKAPQFSKR